jgi:hypothetical protein
MKKNIIICFAFLGLLFLVPFTAFSVAAPEDYVGVEVGDSFKWTLKINVDTFMKFAEDLNETIDISELEGLEEMPSLYFKAEVLSLSETSGIINSTLITYTEVNVTLTLGVPGVGEMPLEDYPIPIWVPSNETDYYMHFVYYIMMEAISYSPTPIFAFLFVAYNLNWTKLVEDINELYGLNPAYSGVEVAEENNGFSLTIPEGLFNETQKALKFIMTYTADGVLKLARFSYDGATMMSLTLGGDEGGIPGYELLIIIGITSIACIALISVINKRKKNLI